MTDAAVLLMEMMEETDAIDGSETPDVDNEVLSEMSGGQ